MSRHGNDLDDPSDQHLYAIYDHVEREVFKFGVSNRKVGEDDQCSRMRGQVNQGNRWANFLRYSARIITRLISGRRAARAMEDEAIERFKEKRGRLPRGNPDHTPLSSAEKKKLK